MIKLVSSFRGLYVQWSHSSARGLNASSRSNPANKSPRPHNNVCVPPARVGWAAMLATPRDVDSQLIRFPV